ncbi:MAG: gamma-glutamyltransferase [Pseudomonadota bacterium]
MTSRSSRIGACLLLLCFLLSTTAFAEGRKAAVAIPEPLAAAIARDILRRGGNAIDAAVATAFALAVTLPDAGNIGGGGFMTTYFEGSSEFLDYRETAPASATRDMYLDADGTASTNQSLVGHRAAGVPGTVAGMAEAHARYGRLPWASLVQPAVALARDGIDPEHWFIEAIRESEPDYAGATNFAAYYGRAKEGERFVQTELADTLERIAKEGASDFYEGETAQLLVAEMRAGGGEISAEDLKAYEPVWRKPLRRAWRGYEIVSAPLPSSGGFAIIQYLLMRDLLSKDFSGLELNSAQYVHLKAELEKRIFADRARYLGDPEFIDFDLSKLLTPEYIQRRTASVSRSAPSATEDVKPGLDGLHTTHFSILDFEGNAVSNTYTLNTGFGSGVVVRGAGFLLNNEMDDFAIAPGIPNYYGVVGDEANAIAPGKRMLSSMSPTILLKDGMPVMVLGAMGGSTIFTTVYQTISNLVDFGLNAKQALAATRVHHQLLPENLISYSPTTPLDAAVISELRERGYRVEPHGWEYGNVQLIWLSPTGDLQAASDPRFSGVSEVLLEDP